MQVILKEDVRHLGDVGDVVNVKAGYARNYLLPRGLAVHADSRQLNRLEHEKRLIEAKVAQLRGSAVEEAKKYEGFTLVIKKAAGEQDKLFGSVTSIEIESLLQEKGFNVERRQILLNENIKSLGETTVSVKLHREVVISLKVLVLRDDS